MTSPRPAIVLANALRILEADEISRLSGLSGVSTEVIWRAKNGRHGRPTRADHYIALCAALGLDPADGHFIEPAPPRAFLPSFFAAGVKGRRILDGHSQRVAAKSMGISLTTLSRIENGWSVGAPAMLAACRYVGAHPLDYCQPLLVSREMSGNTLNKKDNRVSA